MTLLTVGVAVVGLILIIILYGFHAYILNIRHRLPPGPIPIPFLGNLLVFADVTKRPWKAASEIATKYGGMCTLYYGQYLLITIHNSEFLKEAIVSKAKYFSDRPHACIPFFDALKTGMISASGDDWRDRRRFFLRWMRDFGMGKTAIVFQIRDEVDHLLIEIDRTADRPFQPSRLIANAVSNVICSLVFGKRFNYSDSEFLEILEILETHVRRSFETNAIYFMIPALRFVFQPPYVNALKKLGKHVGKIFMRAVEEHRQDYDKNQIRDFPDLYIFSEGSSDSPFDYHSFMVTICEMFQAGTETTGTAINWTLLYLSTWQDIQIRCQENIDQVVGCDRLPSLDDRPELVYIEAVMCEVLRHANIAPQALAHANIESSSIGGYDIPGGSMVMYSTYDVHFDKDYWGDPEKFRPERWIGSNGKLLSHSGYFLPFGAGPRFCMGEVLARVEYFLFVSALLQRFSFSLKQPVDLNDGTNGMIHQPPIYELIVHRRH